MATGGTGDVLAGLVGALLARHDALARGRARRSSCTDAPATSRRQRLGQESLLAGDLVDALARRRSVGRVRRRRHRRAVTRGEAETARGRGRAGRRASAAARSSCSRASWARARPRSCAASRAASGSSPTRWRARPSCCSPRYPARLTLHHADLYRLRGDGDDAGARARRAAGARGACSPSSGPSASPTVAVGARRARRASSTPARTARRITVEESGE